MDCLLGEDKNLAFSLNEMRSRGRVLSREEI